MARPLREQLREKVQENQKRRASTSASTTDRAEAPLGERDLIERATAPIDPSAVLPRLRALEEGTSALEHRVLDHYGEQADVNVRLGEAIARLAARIGVPASDLGL